MNKIILLILALGSLAVISAQTDQPAQQDPWVGTWKLDAGQSQFQTAAPRDLTLQIESMNQSAIRLTVSATDAEGKPLLASYDGKSDGQEYPIAVNGYESGHLGLHRVSDHEYTGQGSTAEGIPVSETITLSADGRTITIQRQVTGSKGPSRENIVLVKQP